MFRMKALARSFVWWPGTDQDIETTIKSFQNCTRMANTPATAHVFMAKTTLAAVCTQSLQNINGSISLSWLMPTQSVQKSFPQEAPPLRRPLTFSEVSSLLMDCQKGTVSTNRPQFTAEAFSFFIGMGLNTRELHRIILPPMEQPRDLFKCWRRAWNGILSWQSNTSFPTSCWATGQHNRLQLAYHLPSFSSNGSREFTCQWWNQTKREQSFFSLWKWIIVDFFKDGWKGHKWACW